MSETQAGSLMGPGPARQYVIVSSDLRADQVKYHISLLCHGVQSMHAPEVVAKEELHDLASPCRQCTGMARPGGFAQNDTNTQCRKCGGDLEEGTCPFCERFKEVFGDG